MAASAATVVQNAGRGTAIRVMGEAAQAEFHLAPDGRSVDEANLVVPGHSVYLPARRHTAILTGLGGGRRHGGSERPRRPP